MERDTKLHDLELVEKSSSSSRFRSIIAHLPYPHFRRSNGSLSQSDAVNCVNLRDCGQVSSVLRPGRIFRSSQVINSKEVQNLHLNSVLDLRVMKKSCRKHADETMRKARKNEQQMRAWLPPDRDSSDSDWSSSTASDKSDIEDSTITPKKLLKIEKLSGTRACPVCTRGFGEKHHVSVPVFHSDLMPWTMKLRVFGNLPGKVKLHVIREAMHFRNPEKYVAGAVVDPKVMGPTVLYKLLLDYSHGAIAKALRLFCEDDNYPVLVHCIHGKDRTGLVVMLLLLLCDVPTKLVVADYIESELQLKAGRDKGELQELDDHLKTDNVIASKAETMVETIAHLEEQHGNIRGYLARIGLKATDIQKIRNNFMQGPQQDALSGETNEREMLVKPQPPLERASRVAQASEGDEPQSPTQALSPISIQAAEAAIESQSRRTSLSSRSVNPVACTPTPQPQNPEGPPERVQAVAAS